MGNHFMTFYDFFVIHFAGNPPRPGLASGFCPFRNLFSRLSEARSIFPVAISHSETGSENEIRMLSIQKTDKNQITYKSQYMQQNSRTSTKHVIA